MSGFSSAKSSTTHWLLSITGISVGISSSCSSSTSKAFSDAFLTAIFEAESKNESEKKKWLWSTWQLQLDRNIGVFVLENDSGIIALFAGEFDCRVFSTNTARKWLFFCVILFRLAKQHLQSFGNFCFLAFSLFSWNNGSPSALLKNYPFYTKIFTLCKKWPKTWSSRASLNSAIDSMLNFLASCW